ncbi:MAG: sigma-70 family RNA polymerase sigma factor [Ignavibacteriae bacterium]|nr:sigma-70 family RNA polymerase sigma factor [Ignavibacteriota bacterium]
MQDDNQLITRAQKGDNIAFEQLVVKYDRIVLNIAYGYRNNKEDAQDIYQEVFLRVYRGLKNFQSRSQFSTWLYRITVNVCIEHKRKEKNYEYQSLNKFDDENENNFMFESKLDSGERVDQYSIESERNSFIKAEIEKLPKQLKMAFTLKYFQGMKIKEISNFMNVSEGTIKGYLFASSKKLREKLKPILEM